MNRIVIGRYIPGNSFLYRMDPRTKLIAMILLMVSVFLIQSFIHMLVALLLVALLLVFGGISVKRVYLGLRPLVFLLIFTFLFQVLFNRQGDLLYSLELHYTVLNLSIAMALVIMWGFTKRFLRFRLLYFLATVAGVFLLFHYLPFGIVLGEGTFSVYEQGLSTAFFIMVRLVIIITLSTILTITTKPTDLNLGLESILRPLRILRINAEEIAMIIAISLRYIPTLLDEANKIMLAQASRGVDFQEGKLKDKVIQVVSLLVPMFIISFQRSDDLANAMETRSFVPGQKRTRLHILHWSGLDTTALAFTCAALIGVILLRVVGW